MLSINVTNNFLADITWLDSSACSFKISNNIDVWKANPNLNPKLVDSFKSMLTGDEIARADRFYQQKDRNRFIISRAALRTILGKYLNIAPEAIEFESGLNKKPFIKSGNQNNLQYNLSHSGDAILLAVADSPIGADVEFINQDFGYRDVLADNFSPRECNYITETDAIHRFFKLWTRKEAITKATAQGLDCDLRLLPGLDGTTAVFDGIIASNEDWVINSFNLNNQYIASVAGNQLIDKISFFDLATTNFPQPL
ncbi:4'-phosphopantetheinyl transferase family protein [Mucilaginibacter flavidus]|uniref:4'-phosphopantetheinyl transferase family protein n=1 Tax=Mucilaginibacter flavidus TaxID=2949309 RepID=UPI0020929993|nr:4'-phosphopantetheinyl transferase superfamily protein [Mucilaginibacter flavidus]MCO5947015.1 4'-phosphopantetheinyl transferase superfamily protein [Mucilaginibacter flavidus]